MLADTRLRHLKPKEKLYKVNDRDGLYVAVTPAGTILFRYNYSINGRQETVTFGRYGVDLVQGDAQWGAFCPAMGLG
ncbi:Arm DNA-binding domain-containing protein [Klebsiella africana]|uniref:Arm DNA-binding domain-containing protein n=1 Tax=Klebsiella africana TaxID=2489010 RepID=A0ACD4AVK5_9ENTR|nr:Arm DNA-binding domain-containing protein [Klebsiella africana]